MTKARTCLSCAAAAILVGALASSCAAPDASSEPVERAQSAIHASNAPLCQQPMIPPVPAIPGGGYPRYNQYTHQNDLYSNTDAQSFLLTLRPKMRFLLPFTPGEAYVSSAWVRDASGTGHGAIDYIKVGPGDPSFKARAVAPGRVIAVLSETESGGEGNSVTIEHYGRDGMNYRSIYVHLRNGAVHDCQQAKMAATSGGYQTFMNTQTCTPGSVDQSIWGPTNPNTTLKVAVGDMVAAGQIIGDVGQTGSGAIGRAISDTGVLNGNNIHLHLYFIAHAPPEGRAAANPNADWVLIDPYGVYGYVGTPNCYLRAANTAGYSMFAPAGRNDFDRDTRTDFTLVRPGVGSDQSATWFVLTRTGATLGVPFGYKTDVPTPGDYDGDGITDISRYDGSALVWYVRPSSSIPGSAPTIGLPSVTMPATIPANISAPGDYDGDGKTDLAVYRPENGQWIVKASGGVSIPDTTFGDPSDGVPVPGDYDGDGRTDFAVFQTMTRVWRVKMSSGGADINKQYGDPFDKPVPADYDGDGKTDIALYRPLESWSGIEGKWYIIYSSTNTELSPTPIYGYRDDNPVPGDYDGDGRTDIAVFSGLRNGTWFALPTSGGEIVQQWGQNTDITPYP
jgi:murein DD-endopeptidase MepM/ murein hydrolase activator NlpD